MRELNDIKAAVADWRRTPVESLMVIVPVIAFVVVLVLGVLTLTGVIHDDESCRVLPAGSGQSMVVCSD